MATGEKHSPHFTGRRKELRLFGDAVRDSTRTGMTVYSFTGELGVGRSALLHEFRVSARERGCAVIRLDCARPCHRIEQGLFDELLAVLPAGSVPGAALRAAGERTAGTQGLDPAAPAPVPPAVLRNAVREAAGHAPLVVTVDDVCRADAAALDELNRMRQACARLPVVMAISIRQGEPATAPRELAALLQGTEQLVLDGLSERDTAAAARAVLRRGVPPEFAAACHRLSAGNPFMLGELLRWAREKGPRATDTAALGTAVLPAVAEAVTGRLDPIDPALGRLAAVIALADDDTADAAPLAAHLSGMTLEQTLVAADLLVRMRLIADDGTVTLRHPVLRTALAGGMTRMARSAAHLSAAGHLHRHGAAAGRVAGHLLASTVPLDDSWSTEVLLQAARGAAAADDNDGALRFLERALRVATGEDHHRAVLLLSDVRLRADWADGVDATVAMLAATGDESVRERLLHRVGRALYEARAPEDTERVLTATAAAVAGTGLSRWPRLHRTVAGLFAGPPARTARLLDELPLPDARSVSDSPGPSPGLRTAAAAVGALCRDLGGGDSRSAVEEARAVLAECGEESSAHPLTVPAALTVLVQNGRYEEAAAAAAHMRRGDRRDDALFPPGCPLLLLVAGQIALGQGRLNEAQLQLGESVGGLSCGGAEAGEPHRAEAVGLLADVLTSLGRNEQAWALLRRHHYAEELAPGWYHRHVLLARARLRAACGDLPGAARDLTELRLRNGASGVRSTAAVPWRIHAVVLLRQAGLLDEAEEAAAEQMRAAEAADTALEHGRALRALADVAGGLRGERMLREAVQLLESAGSELDLALAQADLGALLLRLGRQQYGVAALTEAVRLARRCGARPLAEQVRTHLAAADERTPQHASLRGILALTTRERQILLQATQGLSNRRISTVLGITRRTVELHLSSAYRKLGITGRRDFQEIFRPPGVWSLLADGAPGGTGQRAPAFASSAVPGAVPEAVPGAVSDRADRPFGSLPAVLRFRTEMWTDRSLGHAEGEQAADRAAPLGVLPLTGGS
ncbi:helix-turn-helix transcriptional regulator [Streptomyces odonnellii]|uniref:helix-turn-helix transcriptional regulator n=1 Tax=Streptomyces odonnellii TaxID=1417980 RepID=UPI0018E31B43|nr:LuxR family transcriptional regulator [Streptomyces odonnellii]